LTNAIARKWNAAAILFRAVAILLKAAAILLEAEGILLEAEGILLEAEGILMRAGYCRRNWKDKTSRTDRTSRKDRKDRTGKIGQLGEIGEQMGRRNGVEVLQKRIATQPSETAIHLQYENKKKYGNETVGTVIIHRCSIWWMHQG